MTDLEMTKLCAEALRGDDMSIAIILADGHVQLQWDDGSWAQTPRKFDPLHDDAQAMALVKNMGLLIFKPSRWQVVPADMWNKGSPGIEVVPVGTMPLGESDDLNRAIVECVAKMQVAKGKALMREELKAERAVKADLLAALKRLCDAKHPLDWSPTVELVEAFANARAAIRKAKGEA